MLIEKLTTGEYATSDNFASGGLAKEMLIATKLLQKKHSEVSKLHYKGAQVVIWHVHYFYLCVVKKTFFL
jgi:hypothetical protein